MRGWNFSRWGLKDHQGKLKEKWIQVGILDIALLALGVAFLLGMLLFFGPCELPAEGSWKSCHWAGRMITGIAGALMVLELLHTTLSDSGIRQGLDMGAIILSGLVVLTPGRLIDLCASDTMRCQAAMLPAVRAFAILIAAVSVADFLLQMGKEVRREIRRRRERRAESAADQEESKHIAGDAPESAKAPVQAEAAEHMADGAPENTKAEAAEHMAGVTPEEAEDAAREKQEGMLDEGENAESSREGEAP